VKTDSNKVVRHSLAYLRAKMIGGGRPLLPENLADTDPPPAPLQNADFQSIFTRSASAVTPGKKV